MLKHRSVSFSFFFQVGIFLLFYCASSLYFSKRRRWGSMIIIKYSFRVLLSAWDKTIKKDIVLIKSTHYFLKVTLGIANILPLKVELIIIFDIKINFIFFRGTDITIYLEHVSNGSIYVWGLSLVLIISV